MDQPAQELSVTLGLHCEQCRCVASDEHEDEVEVEGTRRKVKNNKRLKGKAS